MKVAIEAPFWYPATAVIGGNDGAAGRGVG